MPEFDVAKWRKETARQRGKAADLGEAALTAAADAHQTARYIVLDFLDSLNVPAEKRALLEELVWEQVEAGVEAELLSRARAE